MGVYFYVLLNVFTSVDKHMHADIPRIGLKQFWTINTIEGSYEAVILINACPGTPTI